MRHALTLRDTSGISWQTDNQCGLVTRLWRLTSQKQLVLWVTLTILSWWLFIRSQLHVSGYPMSIHSHCIGWHQNLTASSGWLAAVMGWRRHGTMTRVPPSPAPPHLLIWPLNRWPATQRIGYIPHYLSVTSSPSIMPQERHSFMWFIFMCSFSYEGEDSKFDRFDGSTKSLWSQIHICSFVSWGPFPGGRLGLGFKRFC